MSSTERRRRRKEMRTRRKEVQAEYQRQQNEKRIKRGIHRKKKSSLISLDFCTTACCRPNILAKTYSSFTTRLLGINFKESTLYINIDPIPKINPDRTIDIAKKYFGNVVVNIPEKPNFSKALQWCFSQPKNNKYFFYLQDDWILLQHFHIAHLIDTLGKCITVERPRHSGIERRCRIAVVNLRAYKSIGDYRICLSPGLFNTKWASRFAARMDVDYNPEKQTRHKSADNPGGGIMTCYYIALHTPSHKAIVEDIGREWMEKHNIIRNTTEPMRFNGWKVLPDE
jgi:hypothetical protein